MEGYIGQIIMFAGHRIPNNWMLCKGQTLEIKEHTALFSILGTTYGGDGMHTFCIPNITSTESTEDVMHLICVEGIYPDFY